MTYYKSWTTTKLKEVLDESYTRGVSGVDYGPIKTELEAELWSRQEKENEKILKEMANGYESSSYEMEDSEILDALIA